MLRLVLDTNVVLDLLHYADPAAQPLLAAIDGGTVQCFADAAGLEELERVVTYPEFCLSPAAGTALVADYRRRVALVPATPAPPLPRCKDPDDQKFLELAARAGADLLVSKDKALLHLKGRQGLGFAIVTPAGAGAAINNRR